MNRIQNQNIKSTRTAASCIPEMLEGRALMSVATPAATTLTNGVLNITGDANRQDVYVSYQVAGSKIVILQRTTSGYQQTAAFPAASVKSIKATLGAGDDYLYIGSIGAKNVTVDAGAGNDNITTGIGNDVIIGGDGDDILSGADGNDRIQPGKGRDQIFGGKGIDTVDYSDRAENLNITLDGVANDGAAGEFDLVYRDIENVTGGKGNDTITGDTFANVLIGGDGNDVIHGGDGNDTITGGKGADKLFGDAGNDTLYARSSPADADTVDGGAGTDKAQKDVLDKLTTVESVIP